MSEAMKETSDGVVISLADDSLVDPAIAQVSATLWNEKDGRMCSAVQLLVRPLDVRGDEAGGHPGEEFVMVTITRDELRAMLHFVEDDWRQTVLCAGDPNANVTALLPARGPDSVTVGPLAWAVFADNGNIRIWSTAIEPVRKLAEENGIRLVPLGDISALRALIADDSYAMTFQSIGQYRSALLKALTVHNASFSRGPSGPSAGSDS